MNETIKPGVFKILMSLKLSITNFVKKLKQNDFKTNKRSLLIFVLLVLFLIPVLILLFTDMQVKETEEMEKVYWKIQSIDTVKYSRDLAREKLNDQDFEATIDMQVEKIAETGATHIAIGTPYDEEFVAFMEKWVSSARKNNLKVWFRGNLSGWEGWFDYPQISKEEHLQNIERFVVQHPTIFEEGDIFTPCTECENGALGDPRQTGKVDEYRNFLIDEYQVSKKAFMFIGKKVSAGYFSMNADIARLVMDKETTEKLGGIVVIDHYVKDPDKLAGDIDEISKNSGGDVVLGEFGAPIPDIHGNISEEQQSDWVRDVLSLVSKENSLVGINYWVSFEGTTAIWESDGSEKPTVAILRSYYSPQIIKGKLTNEIGKPIKNALIIADSKQSRSNGNGEFDILSNPSLGNIIVISPGYKNENVIFNQNLDLGEIVLEKEKEEFLFRIQTFFYMILKRLGI